MSSPYHLQYDMSLAYIAAPASPAVLEIKLTVVFYEKEKEKKRQVDKNTHTQ